MNRAEYSTRDVAVPAGGRIADVLADAVRQDGDGAFRFRAPAALQSWPGIVHGGALVALADLAAQSIGGPAGARTVEGRLTSSVPSEIALRLAARRDGPVTAVDIEQEGQTLTSATVSPGLSETVYSGIAAADILTGAATTPSMAWTDGRSGHLLPASESCLACGADNPVGLRVRLAFDEEHVWARLVPPPAWRDSGGHPHPALAPVLLDEAAWWLGALRMQEGGLTNRISLSLTGAEFPRSGLVVAFGRFADARPVDRKRAFWRTALALVGEDGVVLATASIVFRGGPEYSGRQLPYFRARTPADLFARMFPSYVA